MRPFPYEAAEWQSAIVVLLVLGVAVLLASAIDRREARQRRRQRARLRGFIRRAGGWDEWDRGL